MTPAKPAPPISIVVPLYNKAATVARCLNSILAQTFRDVEVIVVDDGSTDGGADIARGFNDPRVRIVSQENRGVSAARNRGISEAAAPLIAFLDADDSWEPLFLDAILHLACRYPSAGIFVTGKRNDLGAAGFVETSAALPDHASTGLVHDYLGALREGTLVQPSNAAVPRSVLDDVGMFPEGVAVGEDRDLWVRITLKYPVACDTRILSVYHVNPHTSVCAAIGNPPYPAVIYTLRRLIEGRGLTPERHDRAVALVDWFVLDHLYNLVEAHNADAVKLGLRTERFYCARFRAEACLLGAAVRCLPLRLIALLKHKHKWLPTRLDCRKVYSGKVLVHRRMLALR